MRFLIFSFLVEQLQAAVECGRTANTANGDFIFVIVNSCTNAGVTTDGTCKNNADDTTLVWWTDKGAAGTDATNATPPGRGATAGDATECAYGTTFMLSSANQVDSDGYWDASKKENYEVAISAVAQATDNTGAKNMVTNHANGVAAIMDGESFSPALYTSLSATTGGIAGSNETPGAAPDVVCANTVRGGIASLSAAKNTPKTPFTAAQKGQTGKCLAGAFTQVAAADELAHNAVGDATKNCYHLPWAGSYIAAAACAATETCDRFVESGTQCVTTTKKMASYTAATANTKHCTIQPGAGTNDKYRHLDAAYSSQECDAATNDYCNPYGTSANADPICIPSAEAHGTSAKTAARAAGVLVTGSTNTKWCIGVTIGAKRCATTEVCNPHAASRAELCIDNSTVAANNPKSMAFGAVGAAAPAAGADTRAYCIGDNAAGQICGAATVCNYAGGTQSDTTVGGDVCLPHTKLLGTIADTAPWTAVAQKKLDGVIDKYCLATDGTAYSSKVCATTEKCNPHASSPADVCKKASTVLNHGDIAPEAAEVVADSVVVCIGKSFWKNCASTNGDVKEVCNEGAAALTDVCILTTDCMDPDEPLKAFRTAGVETAADQKWCFATDGAAKCGLDTLCNPSGVDGGTGSAAICADATKRVPHGEAATEELIHCYGDTGNAVLATDESEDGWLCDEGKGKFHDPKTKMEPRSQNETPDPVPEGEKAVEVCFGKDKVETCDVGVYCNSMGTSTGCSDAACTSKNICITEESLIAEGEQWVEEGKSVCLNADATAGEDCTIDKMYCDQTEGVCSAEEIASTEEPTSGGEGEAASGCATQSLAAAAVVAILSA